MYVEIGVETAINMIEDLERRLKESDERHARDLQVTEKLYDTIYRLKDEVMEAKNSCTMQHYDPLGTIPTIKIIRAALGFLTEEHIGEIVRQKAEGKRTGGLKVAKELFDAAREGGEITAS